MENNENAFAAHPEKSHPEKLQMENSHPAQALAAAAAAEQNPTAENAASAGVLAQSGAAQAGVPVTGSANLDTLFLESQVVEMLRTCYDPEIPVNIYELGLVYGVQVTPEGGVHVDMTLTSPQCPVAESLPPEIERKIRGIAGVKEAKVKVVWEPTWTMDKMSQAAKLQLGML